MSKHTQKLFNFNSSERCTFQEHPKLTRKKISFMHIDELYVTKHVNTHHKNGGT
jgi:hypothetical protein